MSCKRLCLRRRALLSWLCAAVFSPLSSTLAAAQDCPTEFSGKTWFVVQRGELQKTEVFHVDEGIVRTVMRHTARRSLRQPSTRARFSSTGSTAV
jgi:hypothetical protein